MVQEFGTTVYRYAYILCAPLVLVICWTVCTRHASLPDATDRLQLANVKPTVPICDSDVELLQSESQLNSLVHSAEQNMLHIADLSTDHMPVVITCDDDELDDFEEDIEER